MRTKTNKRTGNFNRSILNSIIKSLLIFGLLIQFTSLFAQDDFTQIQKITGGTSFGEAVAISGNTLIVGAYLSYSPNSFEGRAYILERDENGAWAQTQTLAPTDNEETPEHFGFDVAIEGDIAIVGAIYTGVRPTRPGAAYIFKRDEHGVWQQIQKIVSGDRNNDDRFGSAVAISNNTILVSAYRDYEIANLGGAVYVFKKDTNGLWQQTQKLKLSDASSNDQFGYSLSLLGDRALIGAPGKALSSVRGTAYIYEPDNNGVWQQIQRLVADDSRSASNFAQSVSLEQSTLVIGTPDNSGAAYIFNLNSNGEWVQSQSITPSDDRLLFGHAVVINGTTIIASSLFRSAAYVFDRQANGNWTQTQKLTSDFPHARDLFGVALALEDKTAIIGSPEIFEEKIFFFSRPGDNTPATTLTEIITMIIDLRSNSGNPKVIDHLTDAIEDLQDALDQINQNDVYEAFKGLEDGIEDLQLAAEDGADISAIIDAIYALADELAQGAAAEAAAFAGNPQVDDYIADAEALLADALDELANGNPDQAVRRLGSAYKAFQWAAQLGSVIAQGMDAENDVNAAIANIQDLIDNGGYSSNANADLEDAIDELNDAITDFNDGDISYGFDDLQDAVEQLQDAEADGADATDEISAITELAKMLAEVKLAEAQNYAGNSAADNSIADAEADIADAEAEILAGNPDRAIGDYRNAWEDARIALEHGRGLRKTENENSNIPATITLKQNYPNPFNPTTNIEFRIADFGFVELKIYDVTGRLVKTLVNENRSAGEYSVQWNATNAFGQKVGSGIYLYKLKAANQVYVKRMLLIK